MPGMLCIAKTASQGKRSNRPSSIMRSAPPPPSSAGWKIRCSVPSNEPCSARWRAAASSIAVWPSWPQACITPLLHAGPLGAAGLVDRQRIHVGAQAQALRALAAHQRADHAGAADAALDRVAPAFELVGHQRGGAVLLEGQLGVAVDVAAQADELTGPGLQRVQQVGHGAAHCGCRLICLAMAR